MAGIKGSVGRNGKNDPNDVKSVQDLLNAFASAAGFTRLKIDGMCGPKTEGAIVAYQSAAFVEAKINGLISPSGPFFKSLAGGLKKAEAEKRKQVEKAVEDKASPIAKAVGEAVTKVLDMPAKGVTKLIQTIIKVLSKVIGLFKGPREMLKEIAKYINMISSFVSANIMKGAQKAIKAAGKTLDAIQAIAKDFPGFIKNLLSAIKKGNQAFLKNFIKHLAAALKQTFTLFRQFIREIEPVETLFAAIGKAKRMLGAILPFLKTALKSIVDLQLIRMEAARVIALEKALLSLVEDIGSKMSATVKSSMDDLSKVAAT